MRQLRAAIVGAGLMGRWHAHAVSRIGARVVAVVDRDGTRAAELARSHGARPAATLTQVLDDVDVVHVCTPTVSHPSLGAEAISAGRHVLMEKPLATSSTETRSLLEQARQRGVLLCPVHQFPFQRGMLDVVEAMPRLTPLRHVDMVICSAGAGGAGPTALDTVALDILPHPLSLLAQLVPSGLNSPWVVHRTAAGEYRLLTVAEGVSVCVLISMAGRPTVNALRLIADHGTAHVNLFHGYAVIDKESAVSRVRKVTQPFTLAWATASGAAGNLALRALRREPAYPGLVELTRRFYGAVSSDTAPPISPEEAVAIAETLESISRTAAGDVTSSRLLS